MGGEIRLAMVEPKLTAVAEGRAQLGRVGEAIMPLMDKVWSTVRSLGVEPLGHNVAVYKSLQDGWLDIECGVEVARTFEAVGDVRPSQLPGGRVAEALHVGSYDGLQVSWEAAYAWMAEQGLQPAGLSWEVYGDWTEDTSKLQTWIRIQVA